MFRKQKYVRVYARLGGSNDLPLITIESLNVFGPKSNFNEIYYHDLECMYTAVAATHSVRDTHLPSYVLDLRSSCALFDHTGHPESGKLGRAWKHTERGRNNGRFRAFSRRTRRMRCDRADIRRFTDCGVSRRTGRLHYIRTRIVRRRPCPRNLSAGRQELVLAVRERFGGEQPRKYR